MTPTNSLPDQEPIDSARARIEKHLLAVTALRSEIQMRLAQLRSLRTQACTHAPNSKRCLAATKAESDIESADITILTMCNAIEAIGTVAKSVDDLGLLIQLANAATALEKAAQAYWLPDYETLLEDLAAQYPPDEPGGSKLKVR